MEVLRLPCFRQEPTFISLSQRKCFQSRLSELSSHSLLCLSAFFLVTRTVYFGFEGYVCPLVSFFVFYPSRLLVWRGSGTLNVDLAVLSWLELHKRYFSWTRAFRLLWLFMWASEGSLHLSVIHLITLSFRVPWGFPGGSVAKNPPASAGDTRDTGSIPESGRSPGGGHGSPLQYPRWKTAWTEGPGGLQSMGS